MLEDGRSRRRARKPNAFLAADRHLDALFAMLRNEFGVDEVVFDLTKIVVSDADLYDIRSVVGLAMRRLQALKNAVRGAPILSDVALGLLREVLRALDDPRVKVQLAGEQLAAPSKALEDAIDALLFLIDEFNGDVVGLD